MLKPLLSLLTSAGIYVLSFKGLVWLWENKIWPLLNKRAYIAGYWRVTNYYDDGTKTEGVYRLRQLMHHVELIDGRNTVFKEGDPYVSAWHSTSGNLIHNSSDVGHEVIFYHSYVVQRHRINTDERAIAVEELTVTRWDDSNSPLVMTGNFKSSLKTVRNTGLSINERITKEDYEEALKCHEELIKRLAFTAEQKMQPGASNDHTKLLIEAIQQEAAEQIKPQMMPALFERLFVTGEIVADVADS